MEIINRNQTKIWIIIATLITLTSAKITLIASKGLKIKPSTTRSNNTWILRKFLWGKFQQTQEVKALMFNLGNKIKFSTKYIIKASYFK